MNETGYAWLVIHEVHLSPKVVPTCSDGPISHVKSSRYSETCYTSSPWFGVEEIENFLTSKTVLFENMYSEHYHVKVCVLVVDPLPIIHPDQPVKILSIRTFITRDSIFITGDN